MQLTKKHTDRQNIRVASKNIDTGNYVGPYSQWSSVVTWQCVCSTSKLRSYAALRSTGIPIWDRHRLINQVMVTYKCKVASLEEVVAVMTKRPYRCWHLPNNRGSELSRRPSIRQFTPVFNRQTGRQTRVVHGLGWPMGWVGSTFFSFW